MPSSAVSAYAVLNQGVQLLPADAIIEMERRRFQPTALYEFRKNKITKFAWLGPMEEVQGNVYPFGAMCYGFSDDEPPCVLPLSKLGSLKYTDSDFFRMDTGKKAALSNWHNIRRWLMVLQCHHGATVVSLCYWMCC